jgi:hypothetical protein
MSSKDNLSTTVPVLDGSNWIYWEAQMKVFLRAKGLWQITTGSNPHPTNLTNTRAVRTVQHNAQAVREEYEVAPAADLVAAWHKEQAISYITLKIAHSLRTFVGDTAAKTWTDLSMALAMQGPPSFLTIFLKS